MRLCLCQCSAPLWAQTRAWFRDYDNVQRLAVLLLYIQIACSLIGSIGALYTGQLVVNLLVALFALVAIESGSQMLGRIYAVLLPCTIFLDITWFILFSNEIRCINTKRYGKYSVFSVRIVLWMQIIGFSVRFLSSFLWFQMYRLGVSSDHASLYRPLDIESRTNLLTPVSRSPAPSRQISISDEVLGGSIYNPAYYSTLFEGREDNGHTYESKCRLDGFLQRNVACNYDHIKERCTRMLGIFEVILIPPPVAMFHGGNFQVRIGALLVMPCAQVSSLCSKSLCDV